ncbi:uncharacterized protein LOC126672140 [Mercurialis annua]|uniref:uncharacterized protein LOC126672140 n=1 Tax=Mercurialis annua TaxID=3986 RepID=UPI002160A2D8|nr:uncharacterized protein LOC126672140 [Mercurialis annua]
MFLVALARSRFGVGKIGVFPFITHEPAKRSSVNRVAGTMETKPITSIIRDVMKLYLIEKVLPAIKKKWPREESHLPIFIQQDNANTHISLDDVDFQRAALKDGFDIRLMCQPVNSPDSNVLKLRFLAAIQSLQYKEAPKNVDEMINVVIKSFEVFPIVKSNHIFLALQLCMLEITSAKGSQQYKIPHMRKSTLERTEELSTQIKYDDALIQEVVEYLNMSS